MLWRTAFGLRLRSCGENPIAAESLGVNVYKYKYIAVIVSGGLAGLGGAFLAIVASHIYQEGQTGGRGYIGLAAMIFGNWMPGGLALGAGLFGFTDSLKLRGGGENVHALLLLLARSCWRSARLAGCTGSKHVRRPSISLGRRRVLLSLWYAADRRGARASSSAPRRTSSRCWCWRCPRSGCGCPRRTACRYRKGQGK